MYPKHKQDKIKGNQQVKHAQQFTKKDEPLGSKINK